MLLLLPTSLPFGQVLTLTAVTVCSLMWLGESFKGRGGYVDEFGHFVRATAALRAVHAV